MDWDEGVPLMGTLPVHWSVTMDEDQEVVVFISPYQQMPDPNTEPGAERTGTHTMLLKPLVTHTDQHLAAASEVMVGLAIQEWIRPRMIARVTSALIEQRDRKGGHVVGTSPFIEDEPVEEDHEL